MSKVQDSFWKTPSFCETSDFCFHVVYVVHERGCFFLGGGLGSHFEILELDVLFVRDLLGQRANTFFVILSNLQINSGLTDNANRTTGNRNRRLNVANSIARHSVHSSGYWCHPDMRDSVEQWQATHSTATLLEMAPRLHNLARGWSNSRRLCKLLDSMNNFLCKLS